ncbi:MAG: hypothetical protein GXO03_02320 [Aquificae bacterium]|nr:hypothetical protein [Aquificota bacterium]
MRDNPYEVLLVLAAGFFYILFAGAYAFFYTLANMKKVERYKFIAFAFAGGMLYCAYILTTNGIFDPFWKWLIGFATAAYIVIPFVMWKVIIRIHEYEKKLKEEGEN